MTDETSNFDLQLRELDDFIDSLKPEDRKLIAVLHKAQEIVGYLPSQVQNHVARRLNIPSSKVYGVVTFYSFFNIEPKGRYKINVCLGTACFVRGAGAVLDEFKKQLNIKEGESTSDGTFSLDAIRCVGACGLAPVITVNGKVYGRVTPADVSGILKEYTA